jgi:hypothetical protein
MAPIRKSVSLTEYHVCEQVGGYCKREVFPRVKRGICVAGTSTKSTAIRVSKISTMRVYLNHGDYKSPSES